MTNNINNRRVAIRRPRNFRPRRTPNQRNATTRDQVHRARGMKLIIKKWFNNADASYAYSINNVSLSAVTSPTIKNYLEGMNAQYRQYRMARVRVYATLGEGMTNDDRVTIMFASRASVLNASITPDTASLRSLLSAPNTRIQTMVNSSNIKLADMRPINMCNYASSGFGQTANPILPSTLQWFQLSQMSQHYWKVGNFAQFLPQPNLSLNTKAINYWYELDFEFRDRISSPNVYDSISHLPIDDDEDTITPPDYDLSESQLDLRNHLLSGAYVPTSTGFPSIGNIGATVTESEILGHTFRIVATNTNYIIAMYSAEMVGSNIVV